MTSSKASFYGLPWGQVIVALGPPKTGKSTFAGSLAEVIPADKIVLLCTKPNEANSFMYRKHGLTERAEVFVDADWYPELGLFKPTGWLALRKRIRELHSDTSVHGIIIDAGTDAIELLSHSSLASMQVLGKMPHSTGDLRASGAKDASFAYYDKIKNGAQSFMNQLIEAATNKAAPKIIIIPWHTQAPNEEEKVRAGVSHEGAVMPMIEGRYREKLTGDCDMVVYSGIKRVIKDGKSAVQHIVQIGPTNERHAAIRAIALPEAMTLPNEYKLLHNLLIGG